MVSDHSFLVGLTIAVPTWVFSEKPTIDHAVMIGILIFVFALDWLTGSTLARRSPVRQRTSHTAIEALIRDFVIVLICASSIFLDFVFESKSFIFAFFTGAFIWQNFYSFLGNIAALGWSNHFPMWLFNLVQDEMLAKLHKYFPHEKRKDDQHD
jgi:phage-related holin